MTDISAQLLEQVLAARAAEKQLLIRGHGSKSFYGLPGEGDALELAGHSGVVDYSPAELVVTVRAGTALDELAAVLADSGQQLAADPPRFEGRGTIGGSLACNQSGPARPWAGSLRDALLGLRLINGKGEHLRFGGQVIKNVAGYDASRLQAGAMGCLGVITELSLKVMPLPERDLHLKLAVDNAAAGLAEMTALQRRPLPLAGACYLQNTLHLRLSGAAAGVEALSAELQGRGYNASEDVQFWLGLRDHSLAFFQGPAPLWRYSVAATTSLPVDDECLVDWGGSQRWLRGSGDLAAFSEQIPAGAGEVCLFRGPRDGEVFPARPEVYRQLQKRLKHAFDPAGLFNPRRLYGWL